MTGGDGAEGGAQQPAVRSVPLDAVRAMLHDVDEVVIACAADGMITFAAGALPVLLGYEATSVVGRNILDFVRPEQQDEIVEALVRWTGRTGTPYGQAYDILAADGTWRPMRYDSVIGGAVEPIGAYVLTLRPASSGDDDRRHLLDRLHNEDRLVRVASSFLRNSTDHFDAGLDDALGELAGLTWVTRVSVWVTEPTADGANPSARRRALWVANATAPRTELPELVPLDAVPSLRRLRDLEEVHIRSSQHLPDDWHVEREWLTAAGVQSMLAVPMVVDRTLVGFVLAEVTIAEIEFDVTLISTVRSAAAIFAGAFRRHEAEVELTRRARTDELTGVPNRWAFEQTLADARAAGRHVVVGVVNVDRFSRVNSALGRVAGDRVLIDATRRMRAALAPEHLLARSQSAEFLLVLAGPGGTGGVAAAVDATQRLLRAFGPPFEIDGEVVTLTASAGLAPVTDPGTGSVELVRRAEVAMRHARQLGGDRVEVDDQQLRGRVAVRLRREADLRRSVAAGAIDVHYQPEWDLRTRTVIGAEALARWRHPVDGLVAAADFIPLAEECGLLGDLGRGVLRAACATVATWALDPVADVFELKVNLSAHQLTDELAPLVDAVLADTGLPASRLCFELTESALLADPEGSIAILTALRDRGVGLAIDDFGTGYSSMVYLKRLPVTLLKIDQSFVAGLPAEPRDRAIVRATVQLAASLAIDVTAEGVEHEDQATALVELGCTRAQGYLLGRPGPAASLVDLLAARS